MSVSVRRGGKVTCEDVLSQARGAAIFAVERGLLRGSGAVEVLRRGGAMQVLDGQAIGQHVRVQVRTWPQLSIKRK